MFCIIDGMIPFAFVIPYVHDIYDTSSKQRFRILEGTSPEIAESVLEMIEKIAPTAEACRRILRESEDRIEKMIAELEELGHGDLLEEGERLAEIQRFCFAFKEFQKASSEKANTLTKS